MTVAKRPASTLRVERREQVFVDDDEDTSAGSGSLRTVDMSFLSNNTSYVDGSGVGHVKVNDSMDWSEVLPNDTTVRIIYQGSGSNEEILIIPVHEIASDSAGSSSSGSSGSGSTSGNSTLSPVASLPTGSSASDSTYGDEGVVGTASSPTTLVIVASVLALIAIAAVVVVVLYGRRNRRRALSEDPSNPDEPFIVGHLPHQAAPQLSALDTDITPDLWVEGQYRYSPNMSGLQNSLNGTAILSDNNTTPAHHRLTVDAYPLSANTQRGQRYRDNALEDISDRGRHRTGTTPVILYEHDSIEERKTNSSRRQQQPQPQPRQQPRQQQQQPQQQQRTKQHQQERMSRRDKYATRRDR
ncbi:hypothetical protein PF006_g4924 [Phytophthora fragariae]|uniref:Uncharacterized protein n=1 Tax=Phytophthora fragariae TaxID=53985 RepID=A0A6A3UGZ3_9STRA|nr:hypothetical protein PF006_g4924 [Phytophthora fragariae]